MIYSPAVVFARLCHRRCRGLTYMITSTPCEAAGMQLHDLANSGWSIGCLFTRGTSFCTLLHLTFRYVNLVSPLARPRFPSFCKRLSSRALHEVPSHLLVHESSVCAG